MGVVKKFPARLHVILARSSNDAVVIRRGPSKSVCVVHWNRQTDKFILGQWLKGRIYERRADLSPDGKYLIYFAMNGRWDSDTGGSWTAISRVPYLKAIVLLGKGDCWHGGGLFTANRHYWINDGHGHEPKTQSGEVVRDNKYQPAENYGGECTGVYYVKLQRDGWNLVARDSLGEWDTTTTFEKEMQKGWVLRKIAHEQVDSPDGKGCYWDEHELENAETGTKLDFENWEWAEVDKNCIVYASGGKLFRALVKSRTELGRPNELHDFNEMTFAKKEAPY